jgi:hypothetical protein
LVGSTPAPPRCAGIPLPARPPGVRPCGRAGRRSGPPKPVQGHRRRAVATNFGARFVGALGLLALGVWLIAGALTSIFAGLTSFSQPALSPS